MCMHELMSLLIVSTLWFCTWNTHQCSFAANSMIWSQHSSRWFHLLCWFSDEVIWDVGRTGLWKVYPTGRNLLRTLPWGRFALSDSKLACPETSSDKNIAPQFTDCARFHNWRCVLLNWIAFEIINYDLMWNTTDIARLHYARSTSAAISHISSGSSCSQRSNCNFARHPQQHLVIAEMLNVTQMNKQKCCTHKFYRVVATSNRCIEMRLIACSKV